MSFPAKCCTDSENKWLLKARQREWEAGGRGTGEALSRAEEKKREKNNWKKWDVCCYRGTDMYTHFKRNYAKKLDHREEKVEKEIDVLRNLTFIYF